MRPAICSGNQFGPIHTTVMPCSLSSFPGTPLCALRTIASFCKTHVAAQLPGKRAVTSAQASGHFPAAQAHGHKYFDTDAFFQSKMAMGHGGLLLAEWLLVLPTLPESRPVLLTFHAPTRWCVWNENLPIRLFKWPSINRNKGNHEYVSYGACIKAVPRGFHKAGAAQAFLFCVTIPPHPRQPQRACRYWPV